MISDKRKPRIDYKFRQWSNVKTWALMVLMVVVAVVGVLYYMTLRDNITMTIRVEEAEDKVDKQTEEWMPASLKMFETNNMTWEKYMAEVKANDSVESIGLWEVIPFSAYSSKDEGVTDETSIGFPIAKFGMYFNLVARAKSSFAGIGDIILVKWWKDLTIIPLLVVDYCPVCESDNPEKAEIDIYFGADYLGAIEFGIQKMEAWIIKSQAIASREK